MYSVYFPDSVYYPDSLGVLSWFMRCTFPIHEVYFPDTWGVLSRYMRCTFPIQEVYFSDTWGVLSRYMRCTFPIHEVYFPDLKASSYMLMLPANCKNWLKIGPIHQSLKRNKNGYYKIRKSVDYDFVEL